MKYIKEYLEYTTNFLGINLGPIAEIEDSYYKMELYDLDYIDKNESEVILKVNFHEKEKPNYNGQGSFKYVHSDIPGFSDVTPIKITGILDDVFDENPEAIIDMLHQIYDQIKR